jgi:gamma-glutamyltranspeptidase/glutathione hydrolase
MSERGERISVTAGGGAIATVDPRATRAGHGVLALGGNAVDAAIAANAVLSVTSPHLCGIGGDLFGIVHTGEAVLALNASGRAPSGADAAALRREGLTAMPFRHDVRSVTVPGCVDGWVTMHAALGRLPLTDVLAAAIDLADGGAAASPSLVAAVRTLDARGQGALQELTAQTVAPGAEVRRPGLASALRAIVADGRDGFYGGAFGEGLLAIGPAWFSADDLATSGAAWVDPLAGDVWGHRVHTLPPNSQGYVTLATVAIAEANGLTDDAQDPLWAHVLIESARLAAHDRPDVLHDAADGGALLDRATARWRLLDRDAASARGGSGLAGSSTTYLCAVDASGIGVSLIQSNAAGFGSWLVEPNTGINLHNRGIGFSLEAGHPAELRPGRRPPHTLAPTLVTRRDGSLAAIVGTAGGDAQPQVVAQLLARILRSGTPVADAIGARRWVLRSGPTGFDTWANGGAEATVVIEDGAPVGWFGGLRRLGHRVDEAPAGDGTFGQAHAIVVGADGHTTAAAEPRITWNNTSEKGQNG